MSEELKKLALAATPGPWNWSSPETDEDLGLMWAKTAFVFKADIDAPANAVYIAAASPDAVLSLIKERDALYEALKETRRRLQHANEVGLIADTLWYSAHETMFEHIDAALALVGGGE